MMASIWPLANDDWDQPFTDKDSDGRQHEGIGQGDMGSNLPNFFS